MRRRPFDDLPSLLERLVRDVGVGFVSLCFAFLGTMVSDEFGKCSVATEKLLPTRVQYRQQSDRDRIRTWYVPSSATCP